MSLLKPLFRQSLSSSGIYLLIFALSLAISATTALKFSNDQIQQAIALQAAKLQAADLVLTDQNPIEASYTSKARQLGLQHTEVTMFSSMAHTGEQFVMVNVKAIDSDFPLRGELRTAPPQAMIQPGQVWLSQRAMDLLQVQIGEVINIADARLKVSAVIAYDSNQELGFSAFSPTVIISRQDIPHTNAIQVGSRVEYRLLLAGTAEQQQRYQQFYWNRHPDQKQAATASANANSPMNSSASNVTLKMRTVQDSNTRLMGPIQNLDTFLQLANILTILLCGIAIALSSQRYVQQHQDHLALIRCMGATRFQILQAYTFLLAFISLIAIGLGSLMGLGFGYALLKLMLQLIPQLSLQFALNDLLIGPLPIAILTSVVVLLGFILPSLWQLLNTPPIRVIRQEIQTARSYFNLLGAGLLSLLLFSLLFTRNLQLSLLVIAALLGLAALLFAVVWMILKTVKAVKGTLAIYIRIPSQTTLQVTALALGLSLISVLLVLRADLLERWQQQLPPGTPNQFVYGLPPFEVDAFRQQLAARGFQATPLYPNVRGRLTQHNGRPFSTALKEKNNALRRELNLTQSPQYPKDNLIVTGQDSLKQPGEVSVEVKLAQELGIQVGDTLSFNLPEGTLDAKVVNLRSVEWESFSPNFFFIFAPNTLDENAGSYLGSFYVPPQEQKQLLGLIQQFSNTVFVDVSLILSEIKSLVHIMVQIITVLALLVSLAGFLVLLACINLMMDERKKEVAILRSFGAAKNQIRRMLTVELGLIGLLAGIVACLFAEVLSAVVANKMELTIQPHLEIWLILPLSMMILSALIGRYRLGYLSDIAPLQSLRDLNS